MLGVWRKPAAQSLDPKFQDELVTKLAELTGTTPEALGDRTTENFFRLFTKVARPA